MPTDPLFPGLPQAPTPGTAYFRVPTMAGGGYTSLPQRFGGYGQTPYARPIGVSGMTNPMVGFGGYQLPAGGFGSYYGSNMSPAFDVRGYMQSLMGRFAPPGGSQFPPPAYGGGAPSTPAVPQAPAPGPSAAPTGTPPPAPMPSPAPSAVNNLLAMAQAQSPYVPTPQQMEYARQYAGNNLNTMGSQAVVNNLIKAGNSLVAPPAPIAAPLPTLGVLPPEQQAQNVIQQAVAQLGYTPTPEQLGMAGKIATQNLAAGMPQETLLANLLAAGRR